MFLSSIMFLLYIIYFLFLTMYSVLKSMLCTLIGTNRWVIYSEKVGLNYDGSQVPAEWFGWLHYKTDLLPHQDPARPKYKWMTDHKPNLSGTYEAYMPYSTTKPKIQSWKPPQ